MKSREVNKSKFEEFIKSYPRDLTIDVVRFCEPPVKTYNDFSDGKAWPDSVVALVVLNESYPKEEDGGVYPYVWGKNSYQIAV